MTTEQSATQFAELLQRFIRLRPNLMLPEHLRNVKEQMDGLRGNLNGGMEDYAFLFRIFIILAQSDRPPTMGELSTCLDVPLSTATRIVDWLVRGNFIERMPDPSDRRVVRVRMTESGQQFFQTSMAFNQQRIIRLLEHFTPEEQTQLVSLLGKLFDLLLEEQANSEK
jgi:DNA-binding MarR family transcriptional regulator